MVEPERRPLSPDITFEEIDKQRALSRLSRPNPNFVKSPEGIAEFKKVGLPWPENANDKHWNDVLERTPDGEGNQYAHKNKTRVTDIARIRLESGKEYLSWNQTEIRYTPLGDPEYKNKTHPGRYPIIEYKHVMKEEKSGYRHPVIKFMQDVNGTLSNIRLKTSEPREIVALITLLDCHRKTAMICRCFHIRERYMNGCKTTDISG